MIAQGDYAEALLRLEQLARQQPLPERGRFLQAYAQFKLGRLEEAHQVLELVLTERFTSEAGLLAGMVELERKRYKEAARSLKRVIERGEDPWAASASRLLDRVEAALAERERRFQAALARAKELLERKQLLEAAQPLDEAEALAPGRLLVRYYRGYLAYRRQDYLAAQHHLRSALAIDPRDEWSRYMLALALRDSGQAVSAGPLLRELVAAAADRQVKQVAQQALEVMSRPQARPASKHELALQLAAGLGLDTNPTYIDETPAAFDEAGLALQISLRLGYQRVLGESVRAGLGLSISERGYAVGGEDAEHTTIGAWSRLLWQPGPLRLALSYTYSLFLFGHQPLLSQHGGELEAKLAVSKKLSLIAGGFLFYRGVHDDRYAYLQALQGGGAGGAELVAGPLSLELSYLVLEDWAGSVAVPLTLYGAAGRASHGQGIPIDYELQADYSMVGHGPALQLRLALPWELRFVGGAGLQRRSYRGPDLLVRSDTGDVTRLSVRQDWQLSIDAELERSLGHGISLVLRYESLDNVSSQNDAELGLARTYSLRLAGVHARWSWLGL